MLIVFCAVYALCGNRLKAKWKRGLLLVVTGFYVAPIGNYKYRIYDWMEAYFMPDLFHEFPVEGKLDKQYAVAFIGNKPLFLGYQRIVMAFLVLSALVTIPIILYRICAYLTLKKKIKKYSTHSVSEECQRLFEQAKSELSVKKRVALYQSADISAPVTTGIAKPVIWLPESADSWAEDELKGLLYHELAHIRHHDLLLYFVGMIIVAMHWFNPLCYLLLHCIRVVNEQYSDETAVRYMSENEKVRYCEMMIETARVHAGQNRMELGFSGQKRNMTRRIDLIMKKRKTSISIAITAGIIGSVMSTVVALAYEPPRTYEYDESTDLSTVVESDEYFFVGDELGDFEVEVEQLPYDDFFMDEERHLFPVESNKERVSCQHTYVSGTRTLHRLDSKGGCVVEDYYAKRCTKCGNIVNGELYQSHTYKVCPH